LCQEGDEAVKDRGNEGGIGGRRKCPCGGPEANTAPCWRGLISNTVEVILNCIVDEIDLMGESVGDPNSNRQGWPLCSTSGGAHQSFSSARYCVGQKKKWENIARGRTHTPQGDLTR